MPRATDGRVRVGLRDEASELGSMRLALVDRHVDWELLLANRRHLDLRCTFLSRNLRATSEDDSLLQRELECTQ